MKGTNEQETHRQSRSQLRNPARTSLGGSTPSRETLDYLRAVRLSSHMKLAARQFRHR